MNIRFVGLLLAALPALLPLSAGAQEQKKASTAPVAQAPFVIRSVTHHEPIPAYLIEAGEKAHAADLRGEELLKAGIYSDAISAFQEALSYEPHDGPAYQHLAETYTAMNQPDKAITAYRTVLYDWPGKGGGYGIEGNPAVWMQFALALLKAGQSAEALTVYLHGYHFLPTDRGPLPPVFTSPNVMLTQLPAAIYAALGLTEYAGGEQNLNLAANYFQQALSLQPILASPYYYLGQILKYKPGHAQEAIDAFNKAAQLGGPEMGPLVDKAMREKAGTADFEAAVKEMGKATQ